MGNTVERADSRESYVSKEHTNNSHKADQNIRGSFDNFEARAMTFKEAKKLMPQIFALLDDPKTIYCGCEIEFRNNWYFPNLQSCGYRIYSDEKRAKRIEAEHIMPAHEFGEKRDCWKNGGNRQNCQLNDNTFALMEGDLHNLYPSVGEVNGRRSNYKFALNIRNPKNYFGKCQMRIDSKRQRAEPPARSRGIVARAYLYMADRYSIALDSEHENLFNRWNKEYAPDKNECLWNELVTKIQGNDNPFITQKCRKHKN